MIKQKGFTLIELMVVIVINGMLMTVLTEIYLHMQQNFRLQNALSEVQSSGRFAIYYLTHNIRMAGYVGCSGSKKIDSQMIQGFSGQNPPLALRRGINKNSDIILLGLCRRYQGEMQYHSVYFYVANSALYMKPKGRRRLELVSNVIRLKFNYGIGSSTILSYLPAPAIKSWRKVHAVEISLLIASKDQVRQAKTPYQFLNKTIVPQDRRWYVPWYSYVGLRENKVG